MSYFHISKAYRYYLNFSRNSIWERPVRKQFVLKSSQYLTVGVLPSVFLSFIYLNIFSCGVVVYTTVVVLPSAVDSTDSLLHDTVENSNLYW